MSLTRINVALVLLIGLSSALSAYADFKISVIGKTKNDSFYEQAFQGCQKFAADVGDLLCLYDGPDNFQDTRGQAMAISGALDQQVDGILLSVTESEFLADRVLDVVREKRVPVITFDSDLLPEHQQYRLAYVGTNNFDFGVALGNYAKRYQTGVEQEICIQSGSSSTPNLNERIRGVRYALSGDMTNRRLTGKAGWKESLRCPFYTLGKRDKALNQLMFILSQTEPPLFLAVAGFAQFSPDYLTDIAPYRARIASGEVVIVSADAEPVQLEALRQNLSTANIGQQPFEMGRLGAQLMYDKLKFNRSPRKEINYLGFYYCHAENSTECTVPQAPSNLPDKLSN